MNNLNNIWIPFTIILLILIIYVISVAIILHFAKKEERKVFVRYVTCSVCGNKIPEDATECPHCHQLIRKSS
jgi:ribosomal protein L40E